LTLMAQAGLHVPARDDSELAVVEDVFADIGDEQSIEQSLSTFSSHMTRIIEVLAGVEAVRRRARPEAPRVLVLFDELGAGTDPDEGSALARSILTYLLDRRVPTVATTHYSELKAFAHETAGAVNASVALDVESLSPTYELEIGLPGRSNALAIAERLGLDSRIIRGARAHLGTAGVRMEGLLRDLERERDAVAEERGRVALEGTAVVELSLGLMRHGPGVAGERVGVRDGARAGAGRALEAGAAGRAHVRARARRDDRSRRDVDELRRTANRIERKIARAARRGVKREAPAEPVEPLQGRPE